MTMVSVVHVISRNPLPDKADQLFYPHLTPGPAGFKQAMDVDPGELFTWIDGQNLLAAKAASKQALMSGGRTVLAQSDGSQGFFAKGRYTTPDIFDMFDMKFISGGPWTSKDEEDRSRVIVLAEKTARTLFGSTQVVGRPISVQGHSFVVGGVLRNWPVKPLFYGGSMGDAAFRSEDEFFIPLNTAIPLDLPVSSSTTCWGKDTSRTGSDCGWLQFWVQLKGESEVSRYKSFLKDYWRSQIAYDRTTNGDPIRLLTMGERLRELKLVPNEVRLQLMLSIGLLVICVVNSASILLARFMGRKKEASLLRALGATRAGLFVHYLWESLIIGLIAAAASFAFAQIGLFIVRTRPDGYAALAKIDVQMVMMTIAAAIASLLIAGAIPAWQLGRVNPAENLNEQ